MSKIKNGGPAFPVSKDVVYPQLNGMSLRDWFAGQALAGLSANPNESPDKDDASDRRDIAAVAYELADAMLNQREASDA